jgi:hypothetical protein
MRGEEKQCLNSIGESPEVYKRLQEAEITGIAWECLRRNPDYQRDYDEIANGARSRCNRRIQEEMGRLLSRLTRKGPFTNRPSFGRRRLLPTVVPVGQAPPPRSARP